MSVKQLSKSTIATLNNIVLDINNFYEIDIRSKCKKNIYVKGRYVFYKTVDMLYGVAYNIGTRETAAIVNRHHGSLIHSLRSSGSLMVDFDHAFIDKLIEIYRFTADKERQEFLKESLATDSFNGFKANAIKNILQQETDLEITHILHITNKIINVTTNYDSRNERYNNKKNRSLVGNI